MPRFRSRRSPALGFAAAVSLTIGAPAFAAATASDTTISVAPRVEIAAPGSSPADFPGITKVREGERLPRLWVVVSRNVRMERGAEVAYAVLRMTCPKGKTWRSGTTTGDITGGVLDRNARAGKRSVLVMASFSTSRIRAGETASGKVLALCR
jgi:hypothetical protein